MLKFVLAITLEGDVRARRGQNGLVIAVVVHSDRVPTKAVVSEHSNRATGRRFTGAAATVVALRVHLARAACDLDRRVDSHFAEGHDQNAHAGEEAEMEHFVRVTRTSCPR